VSDSELKDIVDCTCLRLRRTTRRLTQLYDHALDPTGLTANQFGLLGHLHFAQARRGTGLSIGALAEMLGMDPSTLTRNLKPLAAKGLIGDHPDPADGRARLITITARGRAKLDEALPYWRIAQNAVKQKLGVRAAKDLGKLLDAAFTTFAT